MAGMDAITGKALDELADIRQSVAIILTTPVGSRVMRRDFGSHLFDLVDAPGNPEGALRLIAACADAIARWEQRVVMMGAKIVVSLTGDVTVQTTLKVKASGLSITADVPLVGAR